VLLAYSLIDSCGDSWQVWNFDEKGVSPEGKWCAVFTETVEIIDGKQVAKRTFRHTTAEKAPFWVTIGLFTRADGQCPCGPIICHQAAKLSWLHAAAALDYVNALDTAELKCILTHMKVTLTTNSKKELLKLLRQHLDPAHESKLWGALIDRTLPTGPCKRSQVCEVKSAKCTHLASSSFHSLDRTPNVKGYGKGPPRTRLWRRVACPDLWGNSRCDTLRWGF
jgi:hypothetical protein